MELKGLVVAKGLNLVELKGWAAARGLNPVELKGWAAATRRDRLKLKRRWLWKVLSWPVLLGFILTGAGSLLVKAQEPLPPLRHPITGQPVEPHVGPAAVNGSTCCGVYDGGNPYDCCCRSNGPGLCYGKTDYVGNCVWYAHYAATWLPNVNFHCPNCWIQHAQQHDFQIGSTPRANSIAVWPGSRPCHQGCSGHVAYVVRDLGNGWMRVREQGCYDTTLCNSGDYYNERVASVYSSYFGQNAQFIYPSNANDTTPPNNPTSITSSSHTLNRWSNDNRVIVQWSGAHDPGNPSSGIGAYSWAWTRETNTVPDRQQESDHHTSQTTSPPLADGQTWYFHIRTRDKAGNWTSGAKHYGPFWIDANEPANPLVQETHNIASGWQNVVNDPAFTWDEADDGNGSGVANYTYYWGENENGEPTIQTTGNSFDPAAPCGIEEACGRYLRMQTTDVSGLTSEPETVYFFGYDAVAPTGSFQINNGSEFAFQVSVQVQISASDAGSGLSQMRLSNDGHNWQTWRAYQSETDWLLDAIPNSTHTVYLQLQDGVGNSTTFTQSIYLDLTGRQPESDNYQIITDVQGRGGGAQAGATYSLTGTIGQVIAGDGAASALYQLQSGFHGAWLAEPSGVTPIETYQLLNSVVGQGGGFMLSSGYQLNGTTGQSTNTGVGRSSNYTLTSGYWTPVSGVGSGVEPSPTVSLSAADSLAVSPTPTSTPILTPTLELYGVSVNEGAQFTHDYQVALHLEAPKAIEMKVSNDSSFADAYWEAYAITKTWEIDFSQEYVLPRTVYVRYRDAEGTIPLMELRLVLPHSQEFSSCPTL